MSQQFCLKWNNHMNNMMDVFKNLLSTEAMVDVTLACDGLSLKAHKIVLSACSPFFQSLFLENPCKHPIVILKDMKYTELKAIIEFMYHGEVNVAQDQLSALMKTAETLRVKGLAEVTNEKNQSGDESSHRSVSRTDTPPPKRRRGRTRKRSLSDQSDDGASEPKIKQPDSDIEELSGDMDPSTPYSTASTVPLQSHSTNSFHKSQQDQPVEQGADESFAPEEKFGVEPSKLLEQTLTTDDLPRRSGRSSVQSNMELQRRPRSSTDHSTSLVPVTSTPMSSDALVVANQQPESPPDIKPELLDLEPPMSPVAGPSHSTDENSMMMYMDQSSMSTMPGPSGYQDNSALVSTDSQPQAKYYTGFYKIDVSKPTDKYKRTLYMCSYCNYICGSIQGNHSDSISNHRKTCTAGNAAPSGNQDKSKVKKKVSSKSIAAPDRDEGDPKVKKTVPPKTPPQKLVILNENVEEIVGVAGSCLEGQSVILTCEAVEAPPQKLVILNENVEEIVGVAGSSLEGQSVILTYEAVEVPPQKYSVVNDDDEETMSTAGSYIEEQSDMLIEEVDNTTASISEGQSATLTCEDIGGNAAPNEDQDIIKVKETVPSKNKETGFSEIGTSKPDDKIKRILYMCSDCRYICGSLLSVKNHKKTCTGTCTGEKMPSNKELPADLKTSMYVCPQCDFYCDKEARMKLHYKFCNGGKVSIACQTGDNSQSTSALLTSPPVILSPRPFSSTDTEEAPLPEGKISAECQTDPVIIKTVKTNCDYCNYSCSRPGNLQKHMKTHTGEKNFLCPYCARRFAEKSTLTVHERTHTGARPYACGICEKTFSSPVSRNKHKIRLHTVERPFVCDYCRMGFKFKYDLKCHIRTHSSKIFPGKQYKKAQ